MSTQIRFHNLLCLIGAYTIRQETNNFQKLTIQIYLHVGTQQIDGEATLYLRHVPKYNVASTSMQRHDVASTFRRRYIYVMCPLGNHPNLSPCWDAANNAYPDQTLQLAAPNRGLHHPSKKKKKNTFRKNNHPNLSPSLRERAYSNI